MHCSRSFGYTAVVGSTLWYYQLIAFVQYMFLTVEYLNIFAVNTENILIKIMHVLFGVPVCKVCPETHLTAVRCFVEVSVDVRCILLAVINTV